MREKRILIIDFNHIAHSYMHSNFRLSCAITRGGVNTVVDTTIQSNAIKLINRWSQRGFFPTVVCMDSPVPVKKAYFAKAFDMPVDTAAEYKGSRERMSNLMFDSLTMTKELLMRGGVQCYQQRNYEADDLVFACIQNAKKNYPGVPIDVVTNDADLLPLVDKTVSVFFRSKKGTYAINKDIEKLHYVQVTPDNYQRVVEDLTSFSKFCVPYNTVLLHKVLRGDPADGIKSDVKRLFPPTVFNKMVLEMVDDWLDVQNCFRYGNCIEKFIDRSTGKFVTEEEVKLNPENKSVYYEDPVELTRFLEVLGRYVEDGAVLDHVKRMYKGMNLNQAYAGFGEISRAPANIVKPIMGYREMDLQDSVREIQVRL